MFTKKSKQISIAALLLAVIAPLSYCPAAVPAPVCSETSLATSRQAVVNALNSQYDQLIALTSALDAATTNRNVRKLTTLTRTRALPALNEALTHLNLLPPSVQICVGKGCRNVDFLDELDDVRHASSKLEDLHRKLGVHASFVGKTQPEVIADANALHNSVKSALATVPQFTSLCK